MNAAAERLRESLPELLLLPAETRWLEFKENNLDPQKVGRYLSALANGACLDKKSEAWLIMGVQDDTHRIVGTSKRISEMKVGSEDLELHLRKHLYPRPTIEFCSILWDGKPIEAIRVTPVFGEPVRYRKEAFIRINSQTTELDKYPDLARAIYNSHQDWFECICEGATVDDLEQDALQVARRFFVRRHPEMERDINSWTDEVFLNKLKLMRKDKVTRAALLLLGKSTSSHLLSPAVAEMTWKLDSTHEKAYEHFGLPFILSTTSVLQKIRNYTQKIFPNNSLLPMEVMKYDTEMILEALHNCIAHQDYNEHARIIISELDDRLVFYNAGSFYSGSPSDYPLGHHTPDRYRNKFLAESMKNLGMVDTMGYGIHKMYLRQRERCFPMPDFNLSTNAVELTIYGKTISEDYGRLLMENTDVPLEDVIDLDSFQKHRAMTDEQLAALRQKHLLEGRKPNYFIAKEIAVVTGKKVEYLESKGTERRIIKELICSAIEQVGSMTRAEITRIVEKHLPAGLSEKQKYNLISRYIRELSCDDNRIVNCSVSRKCSLWKLADSDK